MVADSDELLTDRQTSLLQELSLVLEEEVHETCTEDPNLTVTVTMRSADCEAFYELWHKRALERKRAAVSLLKAPWHWIETVGTSCAAVCAELDAMLQQLDELGYQQQLAARKTAYLCEQSEPKLREMQGLGDVAAAIQKRLGMFDHVDGMMRALNQESTFPAPGELDAMLTELDNSAAYLETHYDFNDAPKLLQHFTHLRHRACISMRGIVQRALEQAVADVEDFLQQQPENATVSIQVFYHTFQTTALNSRALVEILRKRMGLNQEYVTAVAELEKNYREVRLRVVTGPLSEYLRTLAAPFLPVLEDSDGDTESQPVRVPSEGDLGSAMQQASVYLFDICTRERSLFIDYLGEVRCVGEQEDLPLLLTGLAQIFQEIMLPTVSVCTSLNSLQEAAEKLQDCVEAHQVNGDDERTASSTIPLVSLRRVQQEVLERLVVFSRAHIDSGIVKYPLSSSDLDYPVCLLKVDGDPSMSPAGKRYNVGRFPPLAQTLEVLSRTYRVLDPCVFEALAEEAVSACLVSLRRVSDALKQRALPETSVEWCRTLYFMDSQLFLVRNLLVLREQVAAFECSAETTRQMEAKSLSCARNASIESELKQVCESFAVDLVARITLPLSLIDGRRLEATHSQGLRDAIVCFCENLRSLLPAVLALIRLYLSDDGSNSGETSAWTESVAAVLFCPIQNRLLAFWNRWLEVDAQRHIVIKDLPDAGDLQNFIITLISPSMRASHSDLAKMIPHAFRRQ